MLMTSLKTVKMVKGWSERSLLKRTVRRHGCTVMREERRHRGEKNISFHGKSNLPYKFAAMLKRCEEGAHKFLSRSCCGDVLNSTDDRAVETGVSSRNCWQASLN